MVRMLKLAHEEIRKSIRRFGRDPWLLFMRKRQVSSILHPDKLRNVRISDD
jgi:hypothetical protein